MFNVFGQTQLLEEIEILTEDARAKLFAEIEHYGYSTLKKQRDALFYPPHFPTLSPLQKYAHADELHAHKGKALIEQGKAGCIILAGGHGSRLGIPGPKGTFPILGKSLFQIFLEKAQKNGTSLPLAIMTSPHNHTATRGFLETHGYFGHTACDLFMQQELPYLDKKGHWLLEEAGKLAKGACGNGDVFARFLESGIYGKWKEKGVETVSIIVVDNALADPFDPKLFGYHQGDITIKAILRQDPEEKVGVIGSINSQLRIQEYLHLTDEEKRAQNPDGTLVWALANTSLLACSMSCIEKLAHQTLPWHIVEKSTEVWQQGQRKKMDIWKCESFIFDALEFVSQAQVLVYPRQEIFAPLKHLHNLKAVQDALG